MGIIGSIRKHSWVAVLIVGIAIVAFIIGDLSKNNRTETFAEIDGNKVTYDYYQRRLTEREKEILSKMLCGRKLSRNASSTKR